MLRPSTEKTGIELLKQVAHELKGNLTSPSMLMWCDHVIQSDGKTFEIPGVFSRIGRYTRKGSMPITTKLPVRIDGTVFLEVWKMGGDVIRTVIDTGFMYQPCIICGKFHHYTELSHGLCTKCSIKLTKTCKYCGALCTFEDDLPFLPFPGATYRKINGREAIVCRDCADDGSKFVKCETCGTHVNRRNTPQGHNERGEKIFFCIDCTNARSAIQCIKCYDFFTPEKMHGNTCVKCAILTASKKSRAEIKSHSYKPTPVFISTTPAPGEIMLGAEIETDKGTPESSLMEFIEKIQAIYLKSDGSLENGFEMVTHPLTLNAHRSCSVIPYGDLFSKLMHAGYSSHDNTTCGLHVHIGKTGFGKTTRAQNPAISRLIYIFEKFNREILTFSRRKDIYYCKFYGINTTGKTPKDILPTATRINNNSRYMAVNLQNMNTVEIRIFKGTLNKTTYIAALELCEYLTKYVVKNKSEEHYPALTWSDLIAGITPSTYPELHTYMVKKALIAVRR